MLQCNRLNYALKVPENSIDDVVQLVINATDGAYESQGLCAYGEIILSDIVRIEPTGIRFKKPILLTLKHSVIELPKHSSIIIKTHDLKSNKWIKLDTGKIGHNVHCLLHIFLYTL